MRKRYLLPIVLALAAIAVLALLKAAPAGAIRASGATCKVWPVSDEPYAQHLARQLGLDAQMFEYSMPRGVKLTAWLEVYVNGSLDESLSRYFYLSTSPEHKLRRHSGSFAFQRYYPNYSSETSAERCRWEFAHFGSGIVEWVNNPCKDVVSSGEGTDSARLGLGETKIIYQYCGQTEESSKKGYSGFPGFLDEASIAELVKHVDVCIFLKVRFDEAEGPRELCNPVHGLPDFVKQE
jgi:hypothetical protein